MEKEIAIYGSIYSETIEEIEIALAAKLKKTSFKYIEQKTVLLYEDVFFELSIEPYLDSFYLTGRYYGSLSEGEDIIKQTFYCLEDKRIEFSADYQEEDKNGIRTSKEFNLTYKKK